MSLAKTLSAFEINNIERFFHNQFAIALEHGADHWIATEFFSSFLS